MGSDLIVHSNLEIVAYKMEENVIAFAIRFPIVSGRTGLNSNLLLTCFARHEVDGSTFSSGHGRNGVRERSYLARTTLCVVRHLIYVTINSMLRGNSGSSWSETLFNVSGTQPSTTNPLGNPAFNATLGNEGGPNYARYVL
jgi:hypothetical protein